jgi:hypothetical protein
MSAATVTLPTTEQLIEAILNAKHVAQILEIKSITQEYKDIARRIHPDVCTLPGADKAFQKLNEFRDLYNGGRTLRDETGELKTNEYWVRWNSEEPCVKWSLENLARLKQLQGSSAVHFNKYLPMQSLTLAPNQYQLNFTKRAIPLSGLTLPQQHVNWVLGRLLEIVAYFGQIGFVHCGLTPESIFITPEDHGIQVCSFYHWTKLGNPVKTISGKYADWYPNELFTNKTATSAIDLEMVKKIAIYLLGDQSGVGIKLRKTHNEKFIDFCLQRTDNAYATWCDYRTLLANNFPKQFHILNI